MSEGHVSSSELYRLLSGNGSSQATDLPMLSAFTTSIPTTPTTTPSLFSLSTDPSHQIAILELQLRLSMLQQMATLPQIPTTIEALNLQILQNQMLNYSTSSAMTTMAPSVSSGFLAPPTQLSRSVSTYEELLKAGQSIPQIKQEPSAMQPKSPEIRRRKRSRASAEPQVSILRQLCENDDEDEVIKLAPKRSVSSLPIPDVYPLKRELSQTSLGTPAEMRAMERRQKVLREEDLPESVGPDSPLRHHPKYLGQSKNAGDFEVIAAMCFASGYMPDEIKERYAQRRSVSSSPEVPKADTECPMEDFINGVISRELISCE